MKQFSFIINSHVYWMNLKIMILWRSNIMIKKLHVTANEVGDEIQARIPKRSSVFINPLLCLH